MFSCALRNHPHREHLHPAPMVLPLHRLTLFINCNRYFSLDGKGANLHLGATCDADGAPSWATWIKNWGHPTVDLAAQHCDNYRDFRGRPTVNCSIARHTRTLYHIGSKSLINFECYSCNCHSSVLSFCLTIHRFIRKV